MPNLALFCITCCLASEEDGERRRLGALGDIDDLLEPGHTEGHILCGHPGVVEGVEGHLGGRLPKGLGGKGTHHLTRLHLWEDRVWKNG